jgi:hypothetical protein
MLVLFHDNGAYYRCCNRCYAHAVATFGRDTIPLDTVQLLNVMTPTPGLLLAVTWPIVWGCISLFLRVDADFRY